MNGIAGIPANATVLDCNQFKIQLPQSKQRHALFERFKAK
jgi:hypothetical protein